MIKNQKYIILLLIIMALASFFRLWQLDAVPAGLWPDEAINANTAVRILDSKNFQVFYPENHGREGLFFLFISFSFAVLGISWWSFKLVPALIGILTIIGQYLFSLEFFRFFTSEEKKRQMAALLASFFLAISFWHINFSRIGFRAILVPLVLVFSFYFFFRGLRQRHIFDFLLSGVIFGLGFHTYISFRLAVLVLGFALIFWFFIALKEKWAKRYIISGLLLLVMAGFVGLPLGLYFLENPEYFVSRAMVVSVFEQENPLLSFLKSFLSHLAMFNFQGDLNWRHNFAGLPQLSLAAGIFSLIAAFWIIHQLIQLPERQRKGGEETKFLRLIKKDQTNQLAKIGGFLFLFVWCFSLLLPAALTTEGIPHSLRSIGVIPMAYLFAGWGACLTYQWAKNKWPERKIKIISMLLLVVMVFSSFIAYFVIWAKRPELENAFTKRFVDVGKELNALAPTTRKYVIKNEGDLPTEVPKFIQRTAGRDEAVYLRPEQVATFDFAAGDFVLIMNKEIRSLEPLISRFPDGTLIEKERILIYEIK